MTEEPKAKSVNDTKTRLRSYESQASSIAIPVKTKEFAKSHTEEISIVISATIAVLAFCVLLSALIGYGISAETNSLIADKKLQDSLQQLNVVLSIDPFSDVARFNRARVLTKLKRRKEALVDFNEVIKHNPNNIEALQRRAALCILLNDYKQVIADCNTLISKQTKDVSVYDYANRAVAYFMLAQRDEAVKDYTTAIRMKPSEFSFFLGRACCYRDMHRYADAIEDYEWVSMLQPGNVDALTGKANCWFLQKNYAKAASILDKAIAENPQSAALYLERGKEIWSRTHDKKALADFDKALALSPSNQDALTERMRAYIFLNDSKQALRDANLLALNGYKTFELYMTRADLEFSVKRYAFANLGYSRAAELQPDNVTPLIKKAETEAAMKHPNTAAQTISKAMQIHQSDPKLFALRGQYYSDAKDFDNANSDFDKALSLNPEYKDAYLWRGESLCEQQQYVSAQRDLEKVLRMDSKSVDAKNFLAFAVRSMRSYEKNSDSSVTSKSETNVRSMMVKGSAEEVMAKGIDCYGHGQYADAINLLSRAVKMNPSATAARRYLALALLAVGDYANSISQFQSVIAQDSGTPSDLNSIALAYYKAHRYEDAISYYTKYLDLNKDDVEANCQLILCYKAAGFSRKAKDLCADAIHSAHALSDLKRYEDLLKSFDVTVKKPTEKQAPALNSADTRG